MKKKRAGSHLAVSQKNTGYVRRKTDLYEKDTYTGARSQTRAAEPQRLRNEVSNESIYRPAYSNERKRASNGNNKGKWSAGKRFWLVVLALFIFGGTVGLGTVELIVNGPSEQAKIMFVRTFMSTGSLKKIPSLFMPQEEVDMLDDPMYGVEKIIQPYQYESSAVASEVVYEEEIQYAQVIELKDITGASWHGKMLLVHDPSLVRLATPVGSNSRVYGQFLTVKDYCDTYGAVAGISAGGYDTSTGEPFGFVINNGEFLYGDYNRGYSSSLAITTDNRLVVGSFSPAQAIEKGYKSGINWGPILIKDGVKQTNLGGGFSARCAIGQTADGTYILVVIEGRMVSSLGATHDEVAALMEENGAINAINLDSGRSSAMVYEGERITKIAIGSGILEEERTMPNCFIVMPEGWTDENG